VGATPANENVAVAIANWNGKQHIARCLDSVFAQTFPPAQVVVVDNGSTDGSAELVEERYPNVRLIRRKTNEGVCRGYNLGIADTDSLYILILNTDVFLNRDFLRHAHAVLKSGNDVGSVAAHVLNSESGKDTYRGLFLRPWISVVNDAESDGPTAAFGGSGSVLLCRRSMLNDIAMDGQILDEAFFAYLEEVDLAWRAHLRGWRCLYAPDAIARHVGSASMEGRVRVIDKPAFFQRHIWKNRYLLLLGNASVLELVVLAPWLLLFELFTWPYLLFRLPTRLHVFLLSHVDVFVGLNAVLRKRRLLASRRVLRDGGMLRWFRFGLRS